MTARKAIVTGGAGFIGSHLVDALLEQGHTVTVIDNFATGRPENLAHHRGNANLKIANVSVADLGSAQAHFDGVDWVFHLAGLADIVPSIRRPVEYFCANVDGTLGVLEAARQHGVKRFVYAASSSCYGIPDVCPTPETAEIRPQYPYALTKYLGEQLTMHWGQVYGLPVMSLRLFNVYGPRSRTTGAYGAVFGVFLAQKLHGQPLTVVGDGTQTRDFVFVRDVADAFIKAAESGHSGEACNVGGAAPQSVNRIVELLGGTAVHVPKRPGEPDCTWADITKTRNLIAWEPKVTLEEGVGVLIDRIEHWREAPVWTPDTIADATREWFQLLSR